jgi:hypothetical protein
MSWEEPTYILYTIKPQRITQLLTEKLRYDLPLMDIGSMGGKGLTYNSLIGIPKIA